MTTRTETDTEIEMGRAMINSFPVRLRMFLYAMPDILLQAFLKDFTEGFVKGTGEDKINEIVEFLEKITGVEIVGPGGRHI